MNTLNRRPLAHLNIQGIMSTFNELVTMLQEYQFDIVALSETWLQDCSFQQNYVQINGYNSVFRNRIGKHGGGVGFFIKVNYIQSETRPLKKTRSIIWKCYILKLVGETKIHLLLYVLRTNRVQTRLKSWNG